MSYVVNINLKDKQVLIVGGGKVAYKKALSVQKAGACLTVLAITFIDEFQKHDWNKLQKAFDRKDITSFFMVIAATDDEVLNQYIVQEANKHHILTQNVKYDVDASCHPMRMLQDEEYTLAFSSHGAYPILGKDVLHDCKAIIEKQYAKKITYLKTLRSYVLSSGIKNRTILLEIFTSLSLLDLHFFATCIETKHANLFCFHGVANKEAYEDILIPFHNKMIKNYPSTGIVYLSDKVINKAKAKGVCVSSLTTMLSLLHELKIYDIEIIPMLCQNGYYYQMIYNLKNQYPSSSIRIQDAVFSNKQVISFIIDMFKEKYLNAHTSLLFVYHEPSNENTFAGYNNENVIFQPINQLDTSMIKTSNVILIPYFTLLGHHVKKDMFEKQNSMYHLLIQQGYHVTSSYTSLLQHEVLQDFIIQSIL